MNIKEINDSLLKRIGLSLRKSINDDEGIVLKDTNIITMKNTPFDLLLVGLDENNRVTDMKIGRKKDPKNYLIKGKHTLEIKPTDVNIQKVKELANKFKKGGTLCVLDTTTKKCQAVLEGENRIFSIPNTEDLVKTAKTAKNEKDLKVLGSKVIKYLDVQDSNKPEYVEINN